MADGLEITVDGIPEFDQAITELAGPAAERILRSAARAGGRVFQLAITEAAPVRALGEAYDRFTQNSVNGNSSTALPPGALKNDIVVHVAKEQDGSISSYTEPGKLTKHVANWVEYGHKLIVHGTDAGTVEAHPFIRPAFEASEIAAQDATATEIASQFVREAAKLQMATGV